MIKNAYRYVTQQVNGEKFLRDTKNRYIFVSQREYRGKKDSFGNVIIESGVNVTLQIIEDISPPIIDRETGRKKDDNQLETFEVTIEGMKYPLPLQKGEKVQLGHFVPEHSYYIDYKLILRFKEIKLEEKKNDAN